MHQNQDRREKRLESWKEIEAYLNRDVRTLRRWEKSEGLPVHRHSHKARASVYAYPSEIDSWRESRKALPASAPSRPLWKMPAFGLTLALCLVMAGNGLRPQSAEAQSFSLKEVDFHVQTDDISLSADGRYLGYTDWAGGAGSVMVRDLRSNNSVVLQQGHCNGKDAGCSFGGPPLFSPDLKSIVYFWYDDHDSTGTDQLRIAPNRPGASPRILVRDSNNSGIEPQGWLADGRSILATVRKGFKDWKIAAVSTVDGTIRVLKTLHFGQDERFLVVRLSADGRYAVYSAPVEGRPSVRRLYALPVDGSPELELTTDEAVSNWPVWNSDGSAIVYTSNQSNSFDLWAMPVHEGKRAGAPVMLKRDVGNVTLHRMSTNGSVFYSLLAQDQFVTVEDRRTSDANSLTEVRERFSGLAPRWSPDGKQLAFFRPRASADQPRDLVVRSLATGEERKYPHTGVSASGPTWFHDGLGVLQAVTYPNRGTIYQRLDIATGATRFLWTLEGLRQTRFQFLSVDDRTLYAWGPRDENSGDVLIAVDLTTGAHREVASLRDLGNAPKLWPSPDGTLLASAIDDPATKERVFKLISTADGKIRELFRTPTAQLTDIRQTSWTPDGTALLFCRSEGAGVTRVMKLPIQAGAAVPTEWRIKDEENGIAVPFLNPASPNTLAVFRVGQVRELWELANAGAVLKSSVAKR